MPFRISKSFEIESGHILSKHPGNCRFPHGHSRRIEIVLIADSLNSADMVCDFKTIKTALDPFLKEWDHALCLNTTDANYAKWVDTYGTRIIPFSQSDPTSEMMAKVIHLEATARLGQLFVDFTDSGAGRQNIRIERVRVTETSSSWAEYFA